MKLHCGLLTISKTPVPLKGICVDIQVKGFVADVSATLSYKNEEQNPVEAVFVFPMDDDSAVYSFEAMVGGKQIVAEIHEKKTAQEMYDDTISRGQRAFLLEEDSSSGDIFTCSVGNLPPGQESAVTLSFVRELALEPDGAVRFVLPAVLNPRYSPPEVVLESVTVGLPRALSVELPYSLEMTATIMSSYGVSSVQSSCDLSPLEYLKEDKTSAQVSLAGEHKFDRDVELLIYYNEVNKPSVIVEAGLPSAPPGSLMADSTVMLNFYPNFPESQEQSSCGEFIFLMDRSGSMRFSMNRDVGALNRIESAKETMVFLLKSLPIGCYFNIFGFGSSFESSFPDSVEYTQTSMNAALKKIEAMDADLGGTEILQPLKHIYTKAGIVGHPRQLFVFTDGEVGDTKSVIAEVRRNSSNHRCFAFGIGEGASSALIKGMARTANGTFEFITGKERMPPKVLQTLKYALQPVVKEVSLKWTLPRRVKSILLSQLPKSIFSGQRVIVYVQLNGKTNKPTDAEVSLEYIFQDKKCKSLLQFSLQPEGESRLTIHRLAAKSVLRDLDGGCDSGQENVKKKILETSLQSGVLSSLTAFIAFNKDLNVPVKGPMLQRNIPLVDYQNLLGLPHLVGGGGASKSSIPLVDYRKLRGIPRLVGGGGGGASKSSRGQAGMKKRKCEVKTAFRGKKQPRRNNDMKEDEVVESSKQKKPDSLLRLISLQNADGSWTLNPAFATSLGLSNREMREKVSKIDVDNNVWATVLAIIWLYSSSTDHRDEWELLEGKALTWIKAKAGLSLNAIVTAGNSLLQASVDPKVFGL